MTAVAEKDKAELVAVPAKQAITLIARGEIPGVVINY